MWDLPRPGLEPVSPALAGRFSTTAPPGKPPNVFEYENFLLIRNKSIGPYVTVTALLVPLIQKIHDDKIYFLTIVFKLTYIHSRNLFSLQRIIGLT